MTNKDKIRAFVQQLLNDKHDTLAFADADPLLSSGRLNSLDVVSVAVFLEENFGVNFSDSNFDQYKFESIDSMHDLTAGVQAA